MLSTPFYPRPSTPGMPTELCGNFGAQCSPVAYRTPKTTQTTRRILETIRTTIPETSNGVCRFFWRRSTPYHPWKTQCRRVHCGRHRVRIGYVRAKYLCCRFTAARPYNTYHVVLSTIIIIIIMTVRHYFDIVVIIFGGACGRRFLIDHSGTPGDSDFTERSRPDLRRVYRGGEEELVTFKFQQQFGVTLSILSIWHLFDCVVRIVRLMCDKRRVFFGRPLSRHFIRAITVSRKK